MARQQARLNVGRLNAFRLGDYFPSVTLHINSLASWRPGGAQGVMVDPSLELSEATGDVPATARFEMRDASSPPQQGQAVYIGLGSASNRLFGGNIIKVSQRQSRYVDMPVWSVECESNHRLLNRRLVSARIQSIDAGQAIRELVSSFAPGFTTVKVPTNLGTIEEVVFVRTRLTNAITKLVQRVGGQWYLDAFNDIHAFVGEETGVSAAATVSATGKFWDWKHERDTSQIRTRVICLGGGHATDGTHPAGSTTIFLDDTEYLTAVNTVAIGTGVYDVASINRTSAPWFIVLSNSLGSGGLFPGVPVGTMVNVFAVAQSTTYQNSIAALEGGDGVHEYVLSDDKLTQAGALQRARAELGLFGTIEQRGSYVTRDPSAMVGRLITLNVASPTHVTSVSAKIQRVSVSRFEESGRSWNANRTHLFPQRAVTYSSGAVRDVYQILGDFERDGS
jgi:hypothetical protein